MRKPTSKERKKERKKERDILLILLWLSSSVSILSKHHILLSFLPFPLNYKFSLFRPTKGKEKSAQKVIQKKVVW
jgi:hypothetical protein